MNYGNHATLSENAIKSNLILILNKILKIASFVYYSFPLNLNGSTAGKIYLA